MMGVLHPVGPEPASTYWARRALVLAAVALLAAIVLFLANLGDGRTQAVPAAATQTPASTSPSTAGTSAALSPSPAATSLSPSAPASASGTPGAPGTPAPTGPVACRPADLRVTLTGRQRLRAADPTTLDLSVINGSRSACEATVDAKTFELRIYSGRDRIWSSADCPRIVRPRTKLLENEQSLSWQQTWNGRRSLPDCKTRSELPRPGTYYATAQLEGSRRVQLRMLLTG